MRLSETELSYKRSAIEGASSIGLMIALFDTLAGDCRRAAEAIRRNDIEARCRELNHAASVLGQLESWLDPVNGGESAQTMARFYAYLRSKLMQAAATKSASELESQIEMILHVRSSWHKLDYAPAHVSIEMSSLALTPTNQYPQTAIETAAERVPFSQTA